MWVVCQCARLECSQRNEQCISVRRETKENKEFVVKINFILMVQMEKTLADRPLHHSVDHNGVSSQIQGNMSCSWDAGCGDDDEWSLMIWTSSQEGNVRSESVIGDRLSTAVVVEGLEAGRQVFLVVKWQRALLRFDTCQVDWLKASLSGCDWMEVGWVGKNLA